MDNDKTNENIFSIADKSTFIHPRKSIIQSPASNAPTIGVKRLNKRVSISHIENYKIELPKKEDKDDDKEWSFYSKREKISFVVTSTLKFILFIILLYLFLLSLSFMSIGFTMVTSYALQVGDIIKFILANPFAALSIGILVTAVMQNATATTSIAVIMVGAGIIPDVKSAVPIIMGANIGTCVTNSFIALTLAGDPQEFKRAFSAATLNDGFNLMTTALMLPIEILSGFLYIVSDKITNAMPFENSEQIAKANFMNAILTPVTDLFILLNATAVDMLSSGDKNIKDVALRCCSVEVYQTNFTELISNSSNLTLSLGNNMTNGNFSYELGFLNQTRCVKECTYWCMPMLRAFGDGGTGLFWIILSIIVLIASLFGIVKVLSLFIVGPIAKGVTKALNASFPGYFKWVSQVILFLIALFLTIIVQSSNIITATLVPLCGIGIISLQKVYVMTLGSNIGTTVTGILTAFTQPPSSLKKAMQLAFVYTLFNTLGVVYWLPLPFLRFPKKLARKLGHTVFQYRWFLYTYVSTVYVICPLFIFGLALIPHWIGLAIFGLPIAFLFLVYLVILFLRSKFPGILPKFLKDFYWLPKFLRSLRPLDRKIKQLKCCQTKVQDIDPSSPRRLSLANNTIPDVIRRMSVIDTIVRETERMSRRSSIISHESSSSSEEEEEEVTEKIDAFNDEGPTKLSINSDILPNPQISSIFKNKAFDWITEF